MPGILQTLLKVSQSVFASADIEKLLPVMLDLIIQETHAERCRIVLFGENGEELFNEGKRRGEASDESGDTRVSRQITTLVKDSNRVFVSQNAMEDPRLAAPAPRERTVFRQRLLSVACAPLRYAGRTFGVLYIDNRGRASVFDEKTGELLQGLADLIAEALKKSLDSTLEQRARLQQLAEEVDRLKGYSEIIGTSPAMRQVYDFIDKVKDLDINVLITGESGTGKELVARALHRKSERADKPFVSVDCTAIAENMLESELFGYEKGAFTGATAAKPGFIEEADGGTLFIDEIGNLNLTVQAKLLRFLENKEYFRLGSPKKQQADVRLIFATNKDLPQLIQEGKFMPDLHFRLKRGVHCELPPLRDRGEDVLLIAEKLLQHYREKFKKNVTGFSEQAKEYLLRYPYPGNVRELDQFVANAVIWARDKIIQPQDFPQELQQDRGAAGLASEVPKEAESDLYADYLPAPYREHYFIHGLPARGDRAPKRTLHERLIIAIPAAARIPLPEALKALTSAFERNYIIQKLIETGGKVVKAAESAGINKKTFINKKEEYGIRQEWYVD